MLPKTTTLPNNLPKTYKDIITRTKNNKEILTESVTTRIKQLHSMLATINQARTADSICKRIKEYRQHNKEMLKANYISVDVYSMSRCADPDVVDELLFAINRDYKVRHKQYVSMLNEMIGNMTYTKDDARAFVEASGISSHPTLRDALKSREDSEPTSWTDVKNVLAINFTSSPMLRNNTDTV